MHGAGEAGAEAILPLSVLWTKMREIMTGIIQKGNRRGERFYGQGLAGVLFGKKEDIQKKSPQRSEKDTKDVKTDGRRTYIQTLNIRVNMKDLKDLRMLERLIDELKDVQNQTDSDEFVTE